MIRRLMQRLLAWRPTARTAFYHFYVEVMLPSHNIYIDSGLVSATSPLEAYEKIMEEVYAKIETYNKNAHIILKSFTKVS